ncbi:DNA-processing protein DprA [Mycoplasmopsis cricetuli]|uniref:DNA-processing protein DprA n=1 Tax=Mycoplasmopsis cricetuli TaxID=171283 RepID=UPI0004708774|nr:DNA-processing protein DprA [Mycoplasmopsis cricetuli]
MNDILLYFVDKFKNNTQDIFKSMKIFKKDIEKEIIKTKELYTLNKIEFIDFYDSNFPISFTKIENPILGFFAKGNIKLLNELNKIYFVSEEENDNYWNDNIEKITKNCTLVTNYFLSEKELVKKFKNKGGKIIYIWKSGLDFIANKKISENELYVSLYPIKQHAKIQHFKQSNYFAAALSDQLIIFSAKKNSKVDHLVSCFLNLGKEISCFPGKNLFNYNNELIKSGARLITYISESISWK